MIISSKNRQLTTLYMCGGYIEIAKKDKLIKNLLSIGKNSYLDYMWPGKFFGPNSNMYIQDLYQLISEGYIKRIKNTKRYSKFEEEEPIHNAYKITPKGKREANNIIEDELRNDSQYIFGIIGKAITYNLIPVGANLCLTYFRYGEMEKVKIPYPVSIFYLTREVNEDLARNLWKFLVERKLNVEGSSGSAILKNKEINVYTLDIRIPSDIVEKRYSYLKFDEHDLKIAKQFFDEFCSSSKDEIQNLMEIKLKLNKFDIISKYPESIPFIKNELNRCINDLEIISKSKKGLNQYWNENIKFIRKLYSITEEEPLEIVLFEGESAVMVKASKNLLELIKKEGLGCYDVIWSTLQISEAFQEKKGVINVIPHYTELRGDIFEKIKTE